jgi:hypothetical protein
MRLKSVSTGRPAAASSMLHGMTCLSCMTDQQPIALLWHNLCAMTYPNRASPLDRRPRRGRRESAVKSGRRDMKSNTKITHQ